MFRMLKREEGKEHEINRWLRYKLSSWVWETLANGFDSLNPTVL